MGDGVYRDGQATCPKCMGDTMVVSPGSLSWVVPGGESGPVARPMHPQWARDVRDQCKEAGVPYFHKQNGEWLSKPEVPQSMRSRNQWGTLDLAGNWFPETTPWNGHTGIDSPTGEQVMYRVGKANAGRVLDGRIWSEMP